MRHHSLSYRHRWILGAGILLILSLGSSFGIDIPREKPEEAALHVRIDSLKIENADMEEALRLLRRKDYARILIGFEKVPRREGAKEKQISLELRNVMVQDILRRLCEADSRYTYEVVDGVLINVFPKGAKEDPNSLLNMRVAKFSVHGAYTAGGVIRGISELAPELRDYLHKKRQEYYVRKGVFPGSPGAIGRGNMPLEFNLELKNVTVREILNKVALHSLTLYRDRSPDRTGWKEPPSSWKYEFIIKPEADTGLGGIPNWDTLN